MTDYYNVAFAGVALLAGLVLMLVIVAELAGDGQHSPAAEAAELDRLTAPLPRGGGAHRPAFASGTEKQRRVDDTMAIDLAEVAAAIEAA